MITVVKIAIQLTIASFCCRASDISKIILILVISQYTQSD